MSGFFFSIKTHELFSEKSTKILKNNLSHNGKDIFMIKYTDKQTHSLAEVMIIFMLINK